MELLTTLGINWQTMVAQLVNFGLLIVVLTYFVYKPILRLLDDRREKVRKSMDDVKAIEQQRRELEEFKRAQMQAVESEMRGHMEEAKRQAESVRKELVVKAQQEADQIVARARQQLEEDRRKMVADLQTTVARLVVKLSEKVLEREFKADDQHRILSTLEKHIPSLVR